MMVDDVVSAVKGVTETWMQEADKRRHISKADPVADTLEYCAGEIASRVKEAQLNAPGLTPDEFAKLPHINVTAQTVRTWIRSGQLVAIGTPKGYRIAPDAKRVMRGTA